MKLSNLRKGLIGGLTASLAVVPIVSASCISKTVSNANLDFINSQLKNVVTLSDSEQTKVLDNNIAKYGLVETRSFNDDATSSHQKLYFKDTKPGYEAGQYYAPELFVDDEKTAITLNSTKSTRDFKLICQKIKIDVEVPAHTKARLYKTAINTEVQNYVDDSNGGHNYYQTAEFFDLGENINTNPEYFSDASQIKSKDFDKLHAGSVTVTPLFGENGNGLFKTKNSYEISYFYDNPTDQTVTKTRYIMISYLSRGISKDESRVETHTKFSLETSSVNLNLITNTGVRQQGQPMKYDGLPMVIPYVLPENKTRIENYKVIYKNTHEQLDITEKCPLTFDLYYGANVAVPPEYSNSNLDITLDAVGNDKMDIKVNTIENCSLVNQVNWKDGEDLKLTFLVNKDKKISADIRCKMYNSQDFVEGFGKLTQESKSLKQDKDTYTLTIDKGELSSVEKLDIQILDGIRLMTNSQAKFNALEKQSLKNAEEELHGWDYEPGQWSDYKDWCGKVVNQLRESKKKNNEPYSENEMDNLRVWLMDHGKIVYPEVIRSIKRKNRSKIKNLKNNTSNGDYQTLVQLNGDPLFFHQREYKGERILFSEFKKFDSNNERTSFKLNDDGSLQFRAYDDKSSRYAYVPFKITLSTDLIRKSLFNLYPSFDINFTQWTKYRAFKGRTGNPYIFELFYFGNTEQDATKKPDLLTNSFDENAPNRFDDESLWTQRLWMDGKDKCVKKFQMLDVDKKMFQTLSNDQTVTLYFGFYVACKSRPNNVGRSSYTLKVTPTFSDTNNKVELINGKESYQKARRFERDSAKNNLEEFNLNELTNSKEEYQTSNVKKAANGFVVPDHSRSGNIRGLYLPTELKVTLPAHSKAKVNVGMTVEEDIHRNHYLSAWDTDIKSYASYYKFSNMEKRENVAEANNLILPFNDKYWNGYSETDNDRRKQLNSADVAFMPSKSNQMKVKADSWEIAAIALEVAVTIAQIALSVYDMVQFAVRFAEAGEWYMEHWAFKSFINFEETGWNWESLAFKVRVFKFLDEIVPYLPFKFTSGWVTRWTAVPYVSLAALISTLPEAAAETLSALSMYDLRNRSDLINTFTTCNDRIYENVELVNDTNDYKVFTFQMGYTNVFKGNRGRENDISYGFAVRGIADFQDFSYLN